MNLSRSLTIPFAHVLIYVFLSLLTSIKTSCWSLFILAFLPGFTWGKTKGTKLNKINTQFIQSISDGILSIIFLFLQPYVVVYILLGFLSAFKESYNVDQQRNYKKKKGSGSSFGYLFVMFSKRTLLLQCFCRILFMSTYNPFYTIFLNLDPVYTVSCSLRCNIILAHNLPNFSFVRQVVHKIA